MANYKLSEGFKEIHFKQTAKFILEQKRSFSDVQPALRLYNVIASFDIIDILDFEIPSVNLHPNQASNFHNLGIRY